MSMSKTALAAAVGSLKCNGSNKTLDDEMGTYSKFLKTTPYSKVTIELKENFNLEEIKKLLSNKGETKISLVIREKNKQAHFLLQENRKFDINHFKTLKGKKYVGKITV